MVCWFIRNNFGIAKINGVIVIVGVLGDLRIRIKNGNGLFVFLDSCCECTFGLSVVCPITVFTVYFVYNISFFVV